MKLESKICKAVKTNKVKAKVNNIDTVKVEDGFGYITNLEMHVKFKTSLQNGNYKKEFLEKGLVQTSSNEYNFNIPKVNFGEAKAMGREVLLEILKAFQFCGDDDLRPIMKGCFVKGNDICATDAHKLYWREDLQTGVEKGIVINKIAEPLLKLTSSDVKIYESDDSIWFKIECEDFELIMRGIGGMFPNYKAVIPKELNYSVRIPKKQLEETLKTGINFSDKDNKTVKFVFDKQKATLIFEDIDRDYFYTNEVETNGDIESGFTIKYNTKFLLDYLKTLDKKTEFVNVQLQSPSRPSLFDGVWLVMPQY